MPRAAAAWASGADRGVPQQEPALPGANTLAVTTLQLTGACSLLLDHDLERAAELEDLAVRGRGPARLSARWRLARDARQIQRTCEEAATDLEGRALEVPCGAPSAAARATPAAVPATPAAARATSAGAPASAPASAPAGSRPPKPRRRPAPAPTTCSYGQPSALEEAVWTQFAAGMPDTDQRVADLDALLGDADSRWGRLAQRARAR